MRRVIAPHRLAILTPVRAALPRANKCGGGDKREPVSHLLETLADDPGDNSARYCGGVRLRERESLWSRAAQGEREEGKEEGRSAEEGRGSVQGV